MVDQVTIKGYKSFKELNLKLGGLNLLIGSNGSGKSNFLSMFEMLNNAFEQRLANYVAKQRGTQIIIATQSSDLISQFEPEDVITVTQTDGVTSMERMRQCCPHFNEWVSEMEKV